MIGLTTLAIIQEQSKKSIIQTANYTGYIKAVTFSTKKVGHFLRL